MEHFKQLGKKINDTEEKAIEKLDSITDEALTGTARKLKEEITSAKADATCHVAGEAARLKVLLDGIGSVETAEDIKNVQLEIKHRRSTANKDATKVYFSKAKSIQITITAQERNQAFSMREDAEHAVCAPAKYTELDEIYKSLPSLPFNSGTREIVSPVS